jgi:HAD superfamily phosphoserine phosphatase-like hydrolase
MNEKLKVAVFDLNQTLYRRSSKSEFFKYICFKRGYKLLHLLELAYLQLAGKLRLIDITTFKENFFNYLNRIPPEKVREYAAEFWQIEYPKHFNEAVLQRLEKHRKDGMLIYLITGGLEIYTKPLLEHIQVDGFLGTRTRYEGGTHLVVGKACKEEEKMKRLEEDLRGKDFEIAVSYSDDKEPILKAATEPYYIESDGTIVPYS